eukprot:289104-Chlamydomonas_euryale.AAC.1
MQQSPAKNRTAKRCLPGGRRRACVTTGACVTTAGACVTTGACVTKAGRKLGLVRVRAKKHPNAQQRPYIQ